MQAFVILSFLKFPELHLSVSLTLSVRGSADSAVCCGLQTVPLSQLETEAENSGQAVP